MLEESGLRYIEAEGGPSVAVQAADAISAAIASLLVAADGNVQDVGKKPCEHGTAMRQEVEALIAPMVPDILALVRGRLQRTESVRRLTPKEFEVLALLARRLSNKQISKALNVEPQTVKWHLKNLFSKLDASCRAQAVCRAATLGILQPPRDNMADWS